jgi:hypothetical protein
LADLTLKRIKIRAPWEGVVAARAYYMPHARAAAVFAWKNILIFPVDTLLQM